MKNKVYTIRSCILFVPGFGASWGPKEAVFYCVAMLWESALNGFCLWQKATKGGGWNEVDWSNAEGNGKTVTAELAQ